MTRLPLAMIWLWYGVAHKFIDDRAMVNGEQQPETGVLRASASRRVTTGGYAVTACRRQAADAHESGTARNPGSEAAEADVEEVR